MSLRQKLLPMCCLKVFQLSQRLPQQPTQFLLQRPLLNSRFDASDQKQPTQVRVIARRIKTKRWLLRKRNIQIRWSLGHPVAVEPLRRYTDNRYRMRIDEDATADYRRISRIIPLPCLIAQHRHRGRSIRIISRCQRPPRKWLHFKRLEVIARDKLAPRRVRRWISGSTPGREVRLPALHRCELLKLRRVLPQILVRLVRKDGVAIGPGRGNFI